MSAQAEGYGRPALPARDVVSAATVRDELGVDPGPAARPCTAGCYTHPPTLRLGLRPAGGLAIDWNTGS
jgi:hypothetical protein